MTNYGVATDYEYTATHKRERLVIWSGPFCSVYEGEALSLPKRDGYMVTDHNGDRIRVACAAPRTEANYLEVDEAISAALSARSRRQEGTGMNTVPGYIYTATGALRLAHLNQDSTGVVHSYGWNPDGLTRTEPERPLQPDEAATFEIFPTILHDLHTEALEASEVTP